MNQAKLCLEMAEQGDFARISSQLSHFCYVSKSLCKMNQYRELHVMIRDCMQKTIDISFQTLLKYHYSSNPISEFEKKPCKNLAQVSQKFWLQHCSRVFKLNEVFYTVENCLRYQHEQTLMQDQRMEVDNEQNDFSIWDFSLGMIKRTFKSPKGQKVLEEIMNQIFYILQNNRVHFLDQTKQYDQTQFEGKLIEKTKQFYQRHSTLHFQKISVEQYLDLILRIIENETCLISLYFDKTTLPKMIINLEEVLIKAHSKNILDRGFKQLIENKNLDSMKLLFNYFNDTNLLHELKDKFMSYIQETGESFFLNFAQSPESNIEIIRNILFLKDLSDKVISECYQSKEMFKQSQKVAFETFMNQGKDKNSPYLVANYMNEMLKKDHSTGRMKELVHELKKTKVELIISVFRYLLAKDSFEKYFNSFLSDRLINKMSENQEKELTFIQNLKKECGQQFTQKVEHMFTDIENSQALVKEFGSLKKSRDIEVEFYILSHATWPLAPPQYVVRLPPQISAIQDNFASFYIQKFKGRNIQWTVENGTCLLKGFYESRKVSYMFEASCIQGIMLQNFNSKPQMTVLQIQQETNIPIEAIVVALKCLCHEEHKILNCSDDKNQVGIKQQQVQINQQTMISINEEFSSKQKRLNINKIIENQAKNIEEQKQIEERVKEDRKFQIDASIVKILKAKKEMSHNDLVQALFLDLKFPMETSVIKNRIESLIDRDYVKRDAEDATKYHYM